MGSRVDPLSMMLNGLPIDPAGHYRVAMNNFLADGGDGFTVFKLGTDQLGGAVDVDAFAAYLTAHAPVPPGPMNRISKAS